MRRPGAAQLDRHLALLRSAWFVESVCSEVLVTFAVRTKSRWYRSRPSEWLIWSSLGAAVLAFAAPYTPMGQRYFGFAPLPWGVAAFVAGLLVAYFLAAELAKGPYFRRYGAPPLRHADDTPGERPR